MQYQDFNIAISTLQGGQYPVSAVAENHGRVTAALPLPGPELTDRIARLADLDAAHDADVLLRETGAALFDWLLPPPLEAHLRIAWDRALQAGQGLRLRLSIDAPELAVWPWELLHDPARDHTFAISPTTLLVRFFDQAAAFGAPAAPRAELPLDLLLVLPAAAELDLTHERHSVEAVAATMPHALRVHALTGVVTRSDLADALLLGDYDIVHFSGHGTFLDGRGYVALNRPDGTSDWVHSGALARLAVNYSSIKLVVLNVCSSGRADDGRAFQGLAPQMVRYGVPAVVAMQYPITDEAATAFAREFYKRLIQGADAGQVDVAVAYARSMLSVLFPGARAWATPVLYTHAADGVIYKFAQSNIAGHAATSAVAQARLTALLASLEASEAAPEDWRLADPSLLLRVRQMLQQAAEAYRGHLAKPDPQAQQAARRGLRLIEKQLSALDEALATVTPA